MPAESLRPLARHEEHDARHRGQVLREGDGERLNGRVLLVRAGLPARAQGCSGLARRGKRRRGEVDDGDSLAQKVRASQGPALGKGSHELLAARPVHHGGGDGSEKRHVVDRRGDVPRFRVEPIVCGRLEVERDLPGRDGRRRNHGRRAQRRHGGGRRRRPPHAAPEEKGRKKQEKQDDEREGETARHAAAVPSSCRALSARTARAPRSPPCGNTCRGFPRAFPPPDAGTRPTRSASLRPGS